MIDTAFLYSTIKNTSGESRYFDFLPPHGVTLADDEELQLIGDIRNTITIGKEFGQAQRTIKAFEQAVADGDLTIVSIAPMVLQDAATGNSKLLVLSGGLLSVTDMPYDSDSDSE